MSHESVHFYAKYNLLIMEIFLRKALFTLADLSADKSDQ